MKILAELLWLVRQLLTVIKREKRDDDEQRIKDDPSGAWAERFGRVHDDASELPADDSSASRGEHQRDGGPRAK